MRDYRFFLLAGMVAVLGVCLFMFPLIAFIFLGMACLFFIIALFNFSQPAIKTIVEAKTTTKQQKLAMRESMHRRTLELQHFKLEYAREQEMRQLRKMVVFYGQRIGAQIEMNERGSIKVFTHPQPSVKITEVKQQEEQKALPAPGTQYPLAPPFASLKSQIRPGHLILGYTATGPIIGDVSDLLSMLFAGKPGTGKSTALLYYLSMLLLVEAQVYVFDHQGSLNDLADFLPYYGDFNQFEVPMPAIYQEIKEREELWRRSRQVRKPMLILADELPAVARYEEKVNVQYSLIDLTEKIVLENRKHNVYCMLSGQSFPAEILPTITRDNCSSRILFNSSDSHARMAGLDAESRKRMLPLLKRAPQGTGILDVSRRAEPDIVAIPYTTVDDARTIIEGNVPRNGSRYGNTWERLADTPESVPTVSIRQTGTLSGTQVERVFLSSEEREQIINLAKAGVPRREMCFALKKGKSYYDIIKQVLDEEGL